MFMIKLSYMKEELSLEQQISLNTWPTQTDVRKVVQLKVGNDWYIIFQQGTESHAEILEKALKQLGIEYKTHKIANSADVPDSDGEEYNAIGMGWAGISMGRKTATFDKESDGYGIPINEEHLHHIKEKLKEKHPEWTIKYYSKVIE